MSLAHALLLELLESLEADEDDGHDVLCEGGWAESGWQRLCLYRCSD